MKINPILNIKYSAATDEKTQTAARQDRAGTKTPKGLPSFSSPDIYEINCTSDNFLIKTFPNLPCPSCGEEMVSTVQAQNYLDEIEGKANQKLAKVLKGYMRLFKPTEKAVAQEVVDMIPDYPYRDLGQIIKILDVKHRGELETKQIEIMNNIAALGYQLNPNDGRKVEGLTLGAKKQILERDENKPFKRGSFIRGLWEIGETSSDRRAIKDIITNYAEELPTSKNSTVAFYAKYSRRSSEEIAHRLIDPSVATTEHIKPTDRGGRDFLSNFLAQCGYCNWERSNNSYKNWLKIKPDMPKNAQKYFNAVAREIGKRPNLPHFYKSYVPTAAKTLKKESEDAISICLPDISNTSPSNNKTRYMDTIA